MYLIYVLTLQRGRLFVSLKRAYVRAQVNVQCSKAHTVAHPRQMNYGTSCLILSLIMLLARRADHSSLFVFLIIIFCVSSQVNVLRDTVSLKNLVLLV